VTEQVHRHDGSGLGADGLLDRFGRDVEGLRIDVDEYRMAPT